MQPGVALPGGASPEPAARIQLLRRPIPGGLAAGDWYHLRVQATGCRFRVPSTLAGSTAAAVALNVRDRGYTATTEAIGLRSLRADVSFRNVTVSAGATDHRRT